MKKFFIVLMATAILFPLSASSAIQGDINGDGRIDISEAIYALQVSAGVYTALPDSCLLTGKGSWASGVYYNLCDVVESGGLTYACTSPHTSETGGIEPTDTDHWAVLSIKGDSAMELKNVVTVSASGADFTDPIAAIESITDAATDNPYLVVIGPGVYALTTTMTMKPYVSVAGSGQQVTRLMGEVSHVDSFYMSFLVVVADNTTLRDLTVVNTGDGGIATAIFTENSSSIIQDVTALCSNGNINFGIATYNSSSNLINVTAKAFNGNNNVGVDIACSSVTMNNVYAEAYDGSTYNYGVRNNCSTTSKSAFPIMINMHAKGSGVNSSNVGIMNDGSSLNTPILRNCTMEGSTDGVMADGVYTQVRVMNSSINGGVRVINGADIACLNSDNGDMRELDTSCVEILPSGA